MSTKIYISLLFLSLIAVSYSVEDQKVHIDIYEESECPACNYLTITSFKKAFYTEGFEKIANVSMYEYGNAKEEKIGNKWVFTCQHGEQECYGNLMMSCAQAHYSQHNYLAFDICVEEAANFKNGGPACAKKLGLNFTLVDTCMTTDEGNRVQHEVAVKTNNLNPPHQYTPWILVNGVHTQDIQNAIYADMLSYVCKVYKGPIKIKACAKKPRFSYRSPRDFIKSFNHKN